MKLKSLAEFERQIRMLKRDKDLLSKENRELIRTNRRLELELKKTREMLSLINGGQSKERWI